MFGAFMGASAACCCASGLAGGAACGLRFFLPFFVLGRGLSKRVMLSASMMFSTREVVVTFSFLCERTLSKGWAASPRAFFSMTSRTSSTVSMTRFIVLLGVAENHMS